ncbi:MAG: nicotinamide-nucleotide amidase [Saprospiraceae bacterium]|jgi:nicotinamide-nucleotide amidase
MKRTQAIIITIGDELLYGQTIDTNSAWLGQELSKIGVAVKERIAVGDTHIDIIDALDRAVSSSDIVLVTGGLGPTKDDITKKAIADFMEVGMHFSQATFERIDNYFSRIGRKTTEAHRAQCMMPDTVDLITNQRGTAPGMWFDYKGTKMLSMPGVPHEMKGIMTDQGLTMIQALAPHFHIKHRILRTAGVGETYLAEKIEDIVTDFPEELSIAYLPGLASVKLRLTVQGEQLTKLESILGSYSKRIEQRVNPWLYTIQDKELEEVIGDICKEKNLKIGTAESCTGGKIAQLITSIPGSSAYFEGCIVSYSNNIKEKVLDVGSDTLTTHGAVSSQTVTEMVKGAIQRLGVDVAVAVSGIAGPGGGSEEKPVGTVWVAVGNKDRIVAKKWQLVKNRDLNIRYSATVALIQMRLFILDRLDDKGNIILSKDSYGIL